MYGLYSEFLGEKRPVNAVFYDPFMPQIKHDMAFRMLQFYISDWIALFSAIMLWLSQDYESERNWRGQIFGRKICMLQYITHSLQQEWSSVETIKEGKTCKTSIWQNEKARNEILSLLLLPQLFTVTSVCSAAPELSSKLVLVKKKKI